ncbi:uncharacterized protein HKW66_Vig0248170 [Vigna angularis]|uniref:Uncharacterized protein n=1 Tax=Phaseolus angularis TaxID=3914 RepID=A0A8T0KT80_PHAAN|nr:uncharacterized protein HKW66_Vig0248170 [Vigna angularis]
MVDEDNTKMVEELASLHKKYDDDKQAWNKEKKLKKEIDTLKKDVAEEKEARARLEADLVGLQKYIIIEHTNEFRKVIRMAKFLYQEVSFTDAIFNVNKDIFEVRMMDVDEIVAAIAIKKTIMVEDVVDDAFKGETAKVSPSIAIDPMNEDEENVNLEDEVEQQIKICSTETT